MDLKASHWRQVGNSKIKPDDDYELDINYLMRFKILSDLLLFFEFFSSFSGVLNRSGCI